MSNTFLDRETARLADVDAAAYRLAAIVSSSDDAIVSKDLNGIVVSWNGAAERIFGYTADEMIGQSIRKIIPADRQGEEDEVLRKVRNGEHMKHFDTVRQRKDGSLVDISLTVSPVRDYDGRIIGASKIARDVTERKRAEELVQQSMQLKDQFLSMVSHELRTPIATVLGNAQLLLRRSDLLAEDDKRQAMVDMVAEAERLQQTIENLLILSRMDAGNTLRLQPLHLPHLVDDAAKAFQRHAVGRQVSVSVEGDVLPAQGEPTLIKHVLENLLSNAAKYSPAGSPISIVVGTSVAGEPEVRVIDEGVGFNDEDAAQLFTPFFRARNASLMAGGMGIGLAVCKRIVEVQGGSIEARSRGEGGAEFRFTLPRA